MGVKLYKYLSDERGSLSVLILSFFMTILITLVALTDISAIYFAKRSLIHATEAAAQRGVRNLNEDAYYRGKYNALQLLINLTSDREIDPGIPIDCRKGEIDAYNAIGDLSRDRNTLFGTGLGVINIEEINCDGYQISLRTSSTASLPFIIPFTRVGTIKLFAHVGSYDERKVTTNYYGINIG